jgi:hypothetical protein
MSNRTKQIDVEYVKELVLCAVNDGDIYDRCGRFCIANLQKKVKRGVFDASKAPKLFEYYFLTLARERYGNGQRMNKDEKALFGKMAYEQYEEEIFDGTNIYEVKA